MSNLISDLHLHCGLKGYASEGHPDYKEHTIWDYYPAQEEELNKLNCVLRAAIKELAKSSQANLDACVASNLRAPFLAIYPVERQMFALDPQKPFKMLFDILLSGKQHAYLGAAVSGFPLEKVEAILANVSNDKDEGVNYYNQFRRERDYLIRQTAARSKNFPEFRFEVASDYQDFRTSLDAGKTICGLFTVEGAHSFGNYLHNSTFKKTFDGLRPKERQVLEDSFRQNITEVKTEDDGRHAPFFVTFCHHFNNLLAGHARSFSAKSDLFLGLHKPGMRHLFNQEPGLNKGFSSLGKEVLELFLDRKAGRRILIDTKHMSVASRKEFYAVIRKKREEENDHIPIIHSHAAVNGWFSLDQAKGKAETKGLDKGHFFSRWQINLTNEDILEMYDSDGIIGVVLHEGRMPGEGFKSTAGKLKKKIGKARAGSPKRARLEQELKDMYLKLVWSNIFHIVKVVREGRPGSSQPANGWKMIALGSDYDGLVDPMDSFPGAGDFQELKSEMIAYLENGKEICFAQNGVAKALPDEEVRELMFGQTAEEILDGILFGNTDRFLSKYFTEAYLGMETGAAEEPGIAVAA